MARHNECRTEGVRGEVIGRKKPERRWRKQQQKDKRAQQAGGCHVLMCMGVRRERKEW
jgi:hypothetical protein